MSAPREVIGLMAGTSGDGVDAAWVTIAGRGEAMRVTYRFHVHQPFPRQLRRRLLAAMAPAQSRTETLTRLDAELGDAFARAALAAIRAARRRPALIGLAGQTVCHLPSTRPGRSATLQLGDPARVAAATGVTTVAHFRQSDTASGGQGAPLVPWTDWVLFRHPAVSRAVQNIGGIGNVTWIPAGGGAGDVVAFDTGPGNMIIDALVGQITGGRERMDRDGRRAARGRVLPGVLEAWLADPFFSRRPPKSTGREQFGRLFLERELPRLRAASRRPDDWVATATALTARCAAAAYRRFLVGFPKPAKRAIRREFRPSKSLHHATEVIVCGGGAANPVLLAMLATALPGTPVRRIDTLGIPAQAKEALSFAMLAAACADRTPSNLPQVTGAVRPAVLGAIYPAPEGSR